MKPQIVELLLVNGPAVRVCQLWIFGTEKMKVVAEIEFFRTNHARPAGSAWKYTNWGHKVVGGTSKLVNAIGIRTCGLDIPTLDFFAHPMWKLETRFGGRA